MVDFSYRSEEARTVGGTGQQYKSIQAWNTKKNSAGAIGAPHQNTMAQSQILNNLDKAAQGKIGTFDIALDNGLAYANPNQNIGVEGTPQTSESFQFSDVVDIINPLQHLPVVSMIYRNITGNKLHPMAQIIGGALYGGPIGTVAGTINAISQVQTGKDLGEQALGFVGLGGHHEAPIGDKNNPEEQLNRVAKSLNNQTPLEELPGTALSFVNLSEPNREYTKIKVADGRTAGSMIVKKQMTSYRQEINTSGLLGTHHSQETPKVNWDRLPAKEPITSIEISSMPPKQDV